MVKKWIGALLAAALTVMSAGVVCVGADGLGETVSVAATVRIEGNDATILAPVTLNVNAGISAAFAGLEPGTTPTAADALVEGAYYSVYAKDPEVSDIDDEAIAVLSELLDGVDIENGWITSMFGYAGDDDYFWMYSSGKATPSDAVSDYVVKEQDDLCFYFADWIMGHRAYFDKTAYAGTVGESVSVSVTGINILNEMYGSYEEIPINGAELLIGEGFSAETPTGIFTDENGVATIDTAAFAPGTYSLSAKWEEDEYGYSLTRAYATLTIEEKKEDVAPNTVYGIFTSGLSTFSFEPSVTEYDIMAKTGYRDYVLAFYLHSGATVTYSLDGGAYQPANNTSSGVPAFYFSVRGDTVTLKAKVALEGKETIYTFRIAPQIATNQIPLFGTSGFDISNYDPEVREYIVTPMVGFSYYRLWGYLKDGSTEVMYAIADADTAVEDAPYQLASFGSIPAVKMIPGNVALFVKVTPQYAKESGYYKFVFE